jgi:hypothetical protein
LLHIVLLSSYFVFFKEEIEGLKDEQKLLRGMASSGIVIASFSHDWQTYLLRI